MNFYKKEGDLNLIFILLFIFFIDLEGKISFLGISFLYSVIICFIHFELFFFVSFMDIDTFISDFLSLLTFFLFYIHIDDYTTQFKHIQDQIYVIVEGICSDS